MKQNKETLKQFFETGDKPTQQQYSDLIDSYIDAKQPEGEANRRFVIDETGEVSVASEQQVPEYNLSPISGTNTVDLLKDGVSVSQIDLTPYLDNTNLARLVSGTVDANGLATFTRDDNSTFTVDLSNLKDSIPQYQAGTNITIDNTDPLQPVINATGGSGGATNLSYDATTRTLASSTGTDAIIPTVTSTNAGLQKPDFYKEDSFTPSLVDDGGGATYSVGTTMANYTRTGNIVNFYISFENITTSGTPTGTLKVTGLPENQVFGGTSNFIIKVLKNSDISSSNLDRAVMDWFGFTEIALYNYTDALSIPLVTFTGGDFRISGSYKTNVYTP
ncbi:hypothetical protein [Tenacibaculum sp. SDUM215027]|uniref:hypothetical protein n=1 Tax=Tenacibaculum sp. SDUM215027 TaxID=3422596 RepID=UPI003D320A4C